MSETIPIKVVRKIIFDILIERSNAEMDTANELIAESIQETGISNQFANSVGWQSCGTRVLADDIKEGIISIEEAIESLTTFEKKEAKRRCKVWLNEKKEYKER